jgi:hypothetical protein
MNCPQTRLQPRRNEITCTISQRGQVYSVLGHDWKNFFDAALDVQSVGHALLLKRGGVRIRAVDVQLRLEREPSETTDT